MIAEALYWLGLARQCGILCPMCRQGLLSHDGQDAPAPLVCRQCGERYARNLLPEEVEERACQSCGAPHVPHTASDPYCQDCKETALWLSNLMYQVLRLPWSEE